MPRLQVAIVAPSLSILGGQAVQADRLVKAWQHDPDVHCWLVPVDPVPPWPLHYGRRLKYVRTLVTQATYLPSLAASLPKADVVHVFSASFSSFMLSPLPAILMARAIGRPVILNYRSGAAREHLGRSRVARRIAACVDLNVVSSRFLVEVFGEFGIPATPIPNVVDLDRFRFRIRRPLSPRLLSTRNFEGLYNVKCTLRAFRLIQDRVPEATLTLVGGGGEEPALRAEAAALGLRGVTFAGRVAPQEIARYYASHDIYLQSPDVDNMPNSILEAFATGLPVVSTDAGGIRAILTHGVHGLLARRNDHEQLAAHVLRLLDTPALAERLVRAAHASCQAYTWSVVRGQWLRAYRSLLPERAPTSTAARAHGPASR